MTRIRSTVAVCAIACCGIVLSACGSSQSSSTSTAAGSGSAQTTSTTKAASGKPLKVGVTSFVNSPVGSVPEVWAGAEVAAKNINDAGGVNGRPIQIVTCNGKGDPKAELACARQEVSEGAIASASDVYVVNPGGAVAITDRAGIAAVAIAAGAPAASTLPTMFPIEFSAASANGCVTPQAIAVAGADAKVAVVSAQNPYAAGVFSLMAPYLKSNPAVKAKYVGAESVPATQQDLSPIIQDLSDKGANYIITNLPPAGASQVVSAAASAGKKWTFCADAGLFGPQTLKKVGPLTKAFLTSGGYPAANSGDQYPLVAQYVKEMNAALAAGNKDADISINGENTLRSWMGVQIIKQVAEGIKGDVTAQSFYDAIKTAKVDIGYAKLDFAKPLGTPPFKRVFQPYMFIQKWNNDTKELDGVAKVNVLTTLGG